MLYNEEAVRANIRNREGKRVFFLGKGDQLTPAARDYLNRERIGRLERAMRAARTAKIASSFLGTNGISILSGR